MLDMEAVRMDFRICYIPCLKMLVLGEIFEKTFMEENSGDQKQDFGIEKGGTD